jgi:hypothetical protein
MRVPDQVRKAVLFVGMDGPSGPEYGGTAYIVALPGGHGTITSQTKDQVTTEVRFPFTFLVTARHLAEELEGNDFYLRVNRNDGSIAVIKVNAETPWWYHPSEKQHVDAAVTVFAPANQEDLDIRTIPIDMFADELVISEHDIGTGDEVFITGLFTKVVETTRNIPIVRTGTVAMMPGEKIPFGKDLIEAYLIESRSIGGLSGSPVFVRETVKMPVGIRFKAGVKLNNVNDATPGESFDRVEMQGTGRFYFFGSVIGHWEIPNGFTTSKTEAVNMGISPIVPAQKIKEILLQPAIAEMMKEHTEKILSRLL